MSRHLPSSNQLALRLSQIAQAYNIQTAPDALTSLGDFLGVGLDSHITDILHSMVEFTAKNRDSDDSLHIPTGMKHESLDQPNGTVKSQPYDESDMPKPDISSIRSLFDIHPALHPPASAAVYKLNTGFMDVEVKSEKKPLIISNGVGDIRMNGADDGSPMSRVDAVQKELLANGLMRLDKTERQSEGPGEEGGKRRSKHTLHWKYEDPALLLKDVLG